jgi:hypothetical protein
MADPRLRSAFQSPWLAALVGAAVVAASLTLTGNLTVAGSSTLASIINTGSLAETGLQTTTSTGTQDNFVINAGTRRLRANNASALTITGFKCAAADCAAGDDGRQLRVCAINSTLTLSHATGSVAANQILGAAAQSLTLAPNSSNACANLEYDGTTTKWRLVGTGIQAVGALTSNTLPKVDANGNLANSLVTDDGTTLAVATNKLTVTEANGNTAIAGTLSSTGAITENSSPVLSGTIASNTIPKGSSGDLANSAINDNGTTVSFGGRALSDTITTGGTTNVAIANTGASYTAATTVAAVSSSATVDTTAGAVSVTGLTSNMFGTKAAGGSQSQQVALLLNSQGMDVNAAIRTNNGDNYFHNTSGSTAFGLAFGSTISAKVHVSGDVLATSGFRLSSSSGPTITAGSNTPEGAVTAPIGSLFLRTNGGAATTLYVKESGAGNTGWVAK